MTALKLGRNKSQKRPELRFARYVTDRHALPQPPASFGHAHLVRSWGMLGNDEVGDCVIAGAYHETMLWNAERHHHIAVDTPRALETYSAVTGYDPSDPSTDRGTDMETMAAYRRKHGVVDSHGVAHKVAAYVDLNPGDLTELYQAAYLFGAVGIGIEVPAFAMDQFDKHNPWDVQRRDAEVQGGHYIPVVEKSPGLIGVVTWGRKQGMTEAFYRAYCDEAIAYLSTEMLTDGKSVEGFNLAALRDDLREVTR